MELVPWLGPALCPLSPVFRVTRAGQCCLAAVASKLTYFSDFVLPSVSASEDFLHFFGNQGRAWEELLIYLLSHVVSGIDLEEAFRIARLPSAARWAHARFCSVCVDVCALVLVPRGPLCSCPVRCGLKEPETSPLGQLGGEPPWWWRDRLWNHRCSPLSAAARGVPDLMHKRLCSFLLHL